MGNEAHSGWNSFKLGAAAIFCLLCFALGPQLTIATEPSEEVELATVKAAVALQEGRSEEALEVLQGGLKLSPEDLQLLFLKACALNRLRRPKEALEILEKLRKELPSRPGLEEEVKAAREMIQREEAQKARYKVQLRAGFEYDSNVPTLAEGFSSRIGKDREDVRFVFQGYGDYRLCSEDPWEVGLALNLYNSTHFELREYDYHGTTGIAYGGYKSGDFLARMKYQFSYYWLDTDSYWKQHAGGPEMWWLQAPWARLGISYSASKNYYFDPQDLDRDSINHRAGFAQEVQLAPKIWVKFHYLFDRENAEGDDWDWTGHEIGLGGFFELPCKFKVQSGLSFYRRDFDHRHSIFKEHRNDDRWTFSVELSRHLVGPLDAALSYAYVRNQSTISFYEYERNLIGFQIRATF